MSYTEHVVAAEKQLRLAIKSISQELADYPTPISGCDVQYNHLLAQRAKLELVLHAFDKEIFVATPRQLNQGDEIETR